MQNIRTEWKLVLTDSFPACRFAAEEFARLMKQMDRESCVRILETEVTDGNCLKIGVAAAEDEVANQNGQISIRIKNCMGAITGSDPGSVLIAVYRFFTECGCGFVRPGREGEYIPEKESTQLQVELCETAAYHHRCICIEGYLAYEHVVRMIDWAPKVGINSYFTQFFLPYTFFERWYNHWTNPYMVPAPVSEETVEQFMADYSKELDKRGMKQHGVGHGWAAAALDLPGIGFQEYDEESIPAEKRKFIALVEGERKLFLKVPTYTNLCYSNPEVKRLVANTVVDYAEAHTELDYLHFWLGDACNNQCECDACVKSMPSDLYVELMNAIDEKLAAKGLQTRIVFCVGYDFCWIPKHARIKNPDRFTLMFAPIFRSYSKAMSRELAGELPTYVRNKNQRPDSLEVTLSALRSWQEVFPGDSFVFDYHFMYGHIKDPGYYRIARVLKEDIENLHSLGLNGFISCQTQRAFMPNGLGMYMLGTALWRGTVDFEKEAALFFDKAYGADGEKCREYCSRLSELFDSSSLQGEIPVVGKTADYQAVIRLIREFEPTIRRHLDEDNFCHRRSWELLLFHGKLCILLADMLIEVAEERMDAAKCKWEKVRDFVRQNESYYHWDFDVSLFLRIWEQNIAGVVWNVDWSESITLGDKNI